MEHEHEAEVRLEAGHDQLTETELIHVAGGRVIISPPPFPNVDQHDE